MRFSKKRLLPKKVKESQIENDEIQEDETEAGNSKGEIKKDMNYYISVGAEIPECQDRSSLESEYKDFPEEQIWIPNPEIDQSIHLYYLLAKSILTFLQEGLGIPHTEATENSCTGKSEQYVMDVLHSCKYVPGVALKTLHKEELPRNLYSRWAISDITLFGDGIGRHGKNFSKIRRDLLPQMEIKDLVEFYYSWKWSVSAKKIYHLRRPNLFINQRHVPSLCYKTGALSIKQNGEGDGNATDSKNEVVPTRKSARMAAYRKKNLLVTKPPTKRNRNSKG